MAYDFPLGDQPYRSPLKNHVSEYNNESIYFHEHAYFLFFRDRPGKLIRKVTGEGIGKIFNPSIPVRDKYPISPYIIIAESHIKISSRLFHKFSFSASKEMYRTVWRR